MEKEFKVNKKKRFISLKKDYKTCPVSLGLEEWDPNKFPKGGSSLSSAQVPNYGEYDQKILAAETAGDKKLAKKLRDDMDREEVESRGLVRANDLKKGTRVVLRNGYQADLVDNLKGNTRLAKVYGEYTEMGSVYTKDILEAKVGENWKKVALSAAQRKAAKKIRAAGW